jgi:hypothetical protein
LRTQNTIDKRYLRLANLKTESYPLPISNLEVGELCEGFLSSGVLFWRIPFGLLSVAAEFCCPNSAKGT